MTSEWLIPELKLRSTAKFKDNKQLRAALLAEVARRQVLEAEKKMRRTFYILFRAWKRREERLDALKQLDGKIETYFKPRLHIRNGRKCFALTKHFGRAELYFSKIKREDIDELDNPWALDAKLPASEREALFFEQFKRFLSVVRRRKLLDRISGFESHLFVVDGQVVKFTRAGHFVHSPLYLSDSP